MTEQQMYELGLDKLIQLRKRYREGTLKIDETIHVSILVMSIYMNIKPEGANKKYNELLEVFLDDLLQTVGIGLQTEGISNG